MTNFGSETWFGKSSQDVPLLGLDEFSDEVFASYTGPEDGLGFVFRDTSKKNMYMFNDLHVKYVESYCRCTTITQAGYSKDKSVNDQFYFVEMLLK